MSDFGQSCVSCSQGFLSGSCRLRNGDRRWASWSNRRKPMRPIPSASPVTVQMPQFFFRQASGTVILLMPLARVFSNSARFAMTSRLPMHDGLAGWSIVPPRNCQAPANALRGQSLCSGCCASMEFPRRLSWHSGSEIAAGRTGIMPGPKRAAKCWSVDATGRSIARSWH